MLGMFLWWDGGGGGQKLASNIQTSVKFASLRSFIFVSFQQMTLKLGNVTNNYFKALFLQSGWILPNLFMSQVEKKNMERFINKGSRDGSIHL